MTMPRIAFGLLLGATLAVYAAMLFGTLPAITAEAGGHLPFDLRPGGYSLAEAGDFLKAITPSGTALYLHVQHWLDLAFPLLYGPALFLAIAWAAPAGWGPWRYAIALAGLAAAGFDLMENAAVAVMLRAGAAGLTPEMAAAASRWTVLKSAATAVAMTVLLLFLAARGWRLVAARIARDAG